MPLHPGESNWRFVPCGPILQDENGRTVERRWGPAQTEDNRSHISHSRGQETSLTTPAQRGFLEVKGGVMLMPSYPQASSAESILAKKGMCIHGRILRYTK